MLKKILLADDSITIQKVVELTFSEGDYQVFSVGNGSQALKKIHEVRPDIALLDVIMPEANGYEVCEKVKRNPETSWIPVLLLTGTFEPFDRKRADAAGANGHLTKPFESQMLISKVEELIASSRHPVIEPERLGKMEIVAGGHTRKEGEDPVLAERGLREPEDEAAELTQQSIVPDRFDDLGEASAPARESEGIRTIRLAAESISPLQGDLRREQAGTTPLTEGPPETWDELASDLVGPASAPEPFRDPGPAGIVTAPPIVPASAFPDTVLPASASPAPPAPDTVSDLSPHPPAQAPAGTLSAADVDLVAARVLEQLSEKVIREIAWEVIPELAENLIKLRIRELEEKITREG